MSAACSNTATAPYLYIIEERERSCQRSSTNHSYMSAVCYTRFVWLRINATMLSFWLLEARPRVSTDPSLSQKRRGGGAAAHDQSIEKRRNRRRSYVCLYVVYIWETGKSIWSPYQWMPCIFVVAGKLTSGVGWLVESKKWNKKRGEPSNRNGRKTRFCFFFLFWHITWDFYWKAPQHTASHIDEMHVLLLVVDRPENNNNNNNKRKI